MEVDDGEFISSPPKKVVRFGGSVSNTLAKFLQGDTNDYELLKHQLSDPDIKDAQIISWLQELRSCVTHLTKDFEQLVSVILRLPWLGRSQDVVEEYLAFLSNLVSAQTVYLRSCLSVTVSSFIPGRIVIKEGDVDISDSDDDDEMQECYVHNLLRITVTFPVLRHEVLELVIGKMLRLDVSAPRRDIEDAEENAAQGDDGNGASQEECLFDMDEDEENVSNSSSPPGGDVMAHAVADRLDVLMTVLLAYIKNICYVNGTLELTRTKELYRDLIAVFDKLILPTHASCHVQYVIFYLCSFRLGLAEAFLEHLWKKIQSPSNPAVIRQTATGYIGSFLARAKFLPIQTVKACLDLLVPWLHQYIHSQDAGSKAFCDVSLHGPFYATCQAVFYTLVFRHRQMVEGNLRKGLAYLQMLNFERIVMCQLNPLKVCLPAVTNMFAAITRKYQLVFCYTIIERNNRQLLPVVRSSLGGDSLTTNANPLDSFFPFDPYLLKRSGKMIQPIYQVWEEVSMCDVGGARQTVKKDSVTEEDDDFLRGESLQSEAVDSAKVFRDRLPETALDTKCLLYVKQREFAATTPSDCSVTVIGSDDATTCHIVVLRHTGSGATCLAHCDGSSTWSEVPLIVKAVRSLTKSAEEGRLELHLFGGFDDERHNSHKLSLNLLELNDIVVEGIHRPVVYGIGVNVKTGEVFPATFSLRGPEDDLRSARTFTGGQMANVYDSSRELVTIGPCKWSPNLDIGFWLAQDDETILQYMSTSPQVEPPHFVSHMKATIQFLLENPNSEALFPGGAPRFYQRTSEGVWERQAAC
ncbi:UNVERIFIED_CONTAM: hypothetical protein FKN15_062223 [Acipenser sinensis]